MEHSVLARLTELAQQGDDDAFSQIYTKFSKLVYYSSVRIIKDEHAADDIAQDTMIALYKNLQDIKNPQALVAYINRIASRRCADYLRKNKPDRMVIDSEQELLSLVDESENFIPEDYLTDKEKRSEIIDIVNELNIDQRTAIILYYYKQIPIKKIAEMLNINKTTIEKRLSRARANLKVKLEVSMKGLAFTAIPTSSLAKIFETDAAEIFTTEISARIWTEVATKIGYTPQMIAKTLPVATLGTFSATQIATGTATGVVTGGVAATGAVSSITGVAAAILAMSPVIKVAAVSAIVVPAMAAGIYFSNNDAEPVSAVVAQETSVYTDDAFIEDVSSAYPIDDMPEQTSSVPAQSGEYLSLDHLTFDIVGDENVENVLDDMQRHDLIHGVTIAESNAVVVPHDTGEYYTGGYAPMFNNPANIPLEEPIIIYGQSSEPTAEDEPTSDIDEATEKSTEAPSEDATNSSDEPTDEPTEPLTNTTSEPTDGQPETEETPVPSPPSPEPPTEENPAPEPPTPPHPGPSIETAVDRILNLPISTAVTQAEMLSILGITALNPDGTNAPIYLDFFDQIDFDAPGSYVIFIRAVGSDGWSSRRPVVVIVG